MNKISASVITGVGSVPQDVTSPQAHAEMAPREFTPLTPPGQQLAAPNASATGQRDVPEHRQALFDRTLGHLQQKLADRRQTSPEAGPVSPGTLSADELRDCDAALQWVSAQLSPAGRR